MTSYLFRQDKNNYSLLFLQKAIELHSFIHHDPKRNKRLCYGERKILDWWMTFRNEVDDGADGGHKNKILMLVTLPSKG